MADVGVCRVWKSSRRRSEPDYFWALGAFARVVARSVARVRAMVVAANIRGLMASAIAAKCEFRGDDFRHAKTIVRFGAGD